MKVQNMTSPKTGRPVPNQFIIYVDDCEQYFQSYQTIIVYLSMGKVFLDKNNWNRSRTTAKYRNQFLGETTAETKAKINSGEYILTDLN